MLLSRSLLITLVLAIHPTLIKTAPYLEQRDGAVCQSGIYGELVPWLIDFQPAQIFCTDVYPVKCTVNAAKRGIATSSTTSKKTSTTTTAKITTSCTTKGRASSSSTTTTTTTTTKISTTTSKATTSTVDAKSSAWAKCQQQPWNVISTLCSCIEQPKPCSVTTSKASSTTTKQTTTTVSTLSTTTSIKTTATPSTSSSSTRSTTTSSSMSTTSAATTTSSNTPSTTSSSTISSTASTTTSSSSSSPLVTSSTTSSTTTEPVVLPTTDCTQLAPASTGVYVAPNFDSFYLECGAYFQEDDTDQYANSLNGDGGTTNVGSFLGCLNLCSTTAGCNYISYYEQTALCHLLSGLYAGPNAASGGTYAGYDRASLQVAT